MVKVSVPFWARIASMVPLTSMVRTREPKVTTIAGRCNTSLAAPTSRKSGVLRDNEIELLLSRARDGGNSRERVTQRREHAETAREPIGPDGVRDREQM